MSNDVMDQYKNTNASSIIWNPPTFTPEEAEQSRRSWEEALRWEEENSPLTKMLRRGAKDSAENSRARPQKEVKE